MRYVRESLGLTIAELAERSGIAVGTIQRIETNSSDFKVNQATAQAICAALYTEVARIFDPLELSNRGRPPHTGGTYRKGSLNDHEIVCSACFLAVPKAPHCNQCGAKLQQEE